VLVDLPAKGVIVGARFRPGMVRAGFGVSAAELLDTEVPLDAVWDRRAADELADRLAAASTVSAKLQVLERLLVSRRDAAKGLPRHPLTVESVGPGMFERATWDQRSDLTTMAAHDSAETLWQNTTLTPGDVDMAQIYDGFSFLTVIWLEALGFCEKGKVGEFIEGGERIALDGGLPINTSGGQLSGGRLHGMGFLHEACVQMWGEGGDRQAPKTPEVVAVGVGGGPVAGSMLLSSR